MNQEELTKRIGLIMWLVFSIIGSISFVTAIGITFGKEFGFYALGVLNIFLAVVVLRKVNKLKQEGDLK